MKVSHPEMKNNAEAIMTMVKLYDFKHYLTPNYFIHITKFLFMKEMLFHFIYTYIKVHVYKRSMINSI